MSKKILVDLENTSWYPFIGIEGLDFKEEDKIYIFCSDNSPNGSIEVIKSISKSKVQVELIYVYGNTKNALDFQLSCFLGQLSKDSKESDYYIISRDNGYSILCDFLKPIKVELVCSFKEIFGIKEVKKIDESNYLETTIKKVHKPDNKRLNCVKNIIGNKQEKEKLRQEIIIKIRNNKKLSRWTSNASSVSGMIVSELEKNANLKTFKNSCKKISSKEDYRKEIINICSDYFI